jgi:hypothetical protein
MLNSAKARALAAVVVAGVAAAVGGVAVSHGGGSSSTASSAPGAAGVYGARAGGPGGDAFGFRSDLAAAASYLGLPSSQLQARMRDGETLAAIAKAQGKSKQGLIDAMVAAETKNLTSAQKAQSLTMIENRVARIVSSSGPPSPLSRPPA